MGPRVAITGLGVVSCVGNDAEQFFEALCAAKTGLAPRERWRREGLTRICDGAVDDAALRAGLAADERQLSRAGAMGLVAARQALADAGLGPEVGDAGLYVNTILGAPATLSGQAASWGDETFAGLEMVTAEPQGARVASLAAALGARGEVQAMVVPCAGNMALGAALDAVRAGEVGFALAGGIEEISSGFFAAFHRIRVLADRCRPFDAERSGMVIGEGAAFVVLEALEAAAARGSRIYAELLAVGCSNDAHDLIAPPPSGHGAARPSARAA